MIWLRYLNLCMGWLYFLLWSLSFYPQIISNFRYQEMVIVNPHGQRINLHPVARITNRVG